MNLTLAKAIVAVEDIHQVRCRPIFKSFPEYTEVIDRALEDIKAALKEASS